MTPLIAHHFNLEHVEVKSGFDVLNILILVNYLRYLHPNESRASPELSSRQFAHFFLLKPS